MDLIKAIIEKYSIYHLLLFSTVTITFLTAGIILIIKVSDSKLKLPFLKEKSKVCNPKECVTKDHLVYNVITKIQTIWNQQTHIEYKEIIANQMRTAKEYISSLKMFYLKNFLSLLEDIVTNDKTITDKNPTSHPDYYRYENMLDIYMALLQETIQGAFMSNGFHAFSVEEFNLYICKKVNFFLSTSDIFFNTAHRGLVVNRSELFKKEVTNKTEYTTIITCLFESANKEAIKGKNKIKSLNNDIIDLATSINIQSIFIKKES